MIKKTLYFGSPAYLSLRNKQLVIRQPLPSQSGESSQSAMKTLPIEDIGIVMIDHREITITSGLMSALMEHTVAVVTCDHKCMPAGLMLPFQGNTVFSERFRSQLESSLPLRKQLWQQTIRSKIDNQSFVLQHCCHAETGNMQAWSKAVKSGDSDNLEARAAAYYWKNLFPELDDFTRDQEGDGINMLLNYGYAILRSVIARALVGSGLLPVMGIHHHNRYNAYCLADDIMEPYRPFVDRWVIHLKGQYGVPEELTKGVKAELLQIPVLDVKIEGKKSPLMVAASQTTASLAKCFSGELRKISYPEFCD